MKGIIIVLTFLLLEASLTASGIIYFIADGSLNKDDIFIIGKKSNGESIDNSDAVIDKKKTYAYKKNDSSIEVALFEIRVDERESKVVIGYEYGGSYILLSTMDAEEDDQIISNYASYDNKLEIIDPDYYNYEDFPGYSVGADSIIIGVKVGEERIGDNERVNPTNIVEKLSTEVEVGSKVYMYAGVSPDNSDNEFKVVDARGDILISMKKEELIIGSETYGLKNNKEELEEDDRIEALEDGIYLNKGMTIGGEGPFEVTIRIKKKRTTGGNPKPESIVEIEGKEIEFSGDTKNYKLSNIEEFELIYSGKGNGFDFILNGDDIVTGEGGATRESDVVYILEAVGTQYEGSVIVKSSSEDSGRQRKSDIHIEVLDTGRGIDIERIEE